jgi:hypothetical protein
MAGPNYAKDEHSYLVLLDDKLVRLAVGVPTYHCIMKKVFNHHAYNLFGMGDIIVIEKLLNVKGHNSLSACSSCKMKGRWNKTGGVKIYYMPLAAPIPDWELHESWDPCNLPQ